MMQSTRSLCLGRPVFADASLSSSDERSGLTAALLERWARLGAKDAVASLRGDFAIAVEDGQGRTLLAVDRFAIRSLCFRVDADGLKFAARADELVQASTGIDPQAIHDYLHDHVIASPQTVFRGVKRLPPGHFAVFDNGRLEVAPYWTPRFASSRASASLDKLKAEFRQLMAKAVSKQLDGTKPACFLSGGTDSSTVAGFLSQVGGQKASTYSIGFDAEGYDEMEYARITARHYGTDHHEYYVTPADLVASMSDVAQSYDQPFGNSSVLPAFYCARMAAADGVSRLLAGDGGDELFGGNSRYAKQKVFNLYGLLPGFVRTGLLEPLFGLEAMRGLPLLGKGSSYVEQARVPMPDRENLYNLLHRLGQQRVLTPEFLSAVNPQAPMALRRRVWQAAEAGDLVDRQLSYDWRFTLAECDLPKVCGSTALAGVEVGFPLLDDELLEFSLRLPASYKVRGLKLRWFFKEALRGFLPDATITKRKQGFGLPFGVWTVRDPGLRQLAGDTLSSLSRRGVVNPAFIDALLKTHLAEHPGYYGEMVWILMMLELWLQHHAPGFDMKG